MRVIVYVAAVVTEAASASPQSKASAQPRSRVVVKVLASCAFGGVLLYALEQAGLPLLPPARAFQQVKWWTVPLAALLSVAATLVRSARWRLLLRPIANVSGRRALSAALVGGGAVVVMPFRLGEMVRPYLISKDKRVPLLAALGTVVAERIIDGLFLSVMLAGALLAAPVAVPASTRVVGLPVSVGMVRGYAWTFLFTFLAAFSALLVFHAASERGARLVRAILGRVSARFGEFVAARLQSFAGGLGFFRHRRLALRLSAETCVHWCTGALSYWVLAWGAGLMHADQSGISYAEAFAVMGVLGLAAVLPGPPGLLGLYQAGLCAGMAMYFPEDVIRSQGAAFVFLSYLIQVGVVILAAGLALLESTLAAAPASVTDS